MTKKTYGDKLKDPRWQKKRLEILNRDKFTCQRCLDTESTLHVHHKTYRSGVEPWDYGGWNFITLCESCHQHETDTMDDVIGFIVLMLKSHWLSDDIQRIGKALSVYENIHAPEVCASVIAHYLENYERFKLLLDGFFEYLEENQKEKAITVE